MWQPELMWSGNDHAGPTTHHTRKAIPPPLGARLEACNSVGSHWVCEEPKAQNFLQSVYILLPSTCLPPPWNNYHENLKEVPIKTSLRKIQGKHGECQEFSVPGSFHYRMRKYIQTTGPNADSSRFLTSPQPMRIIVLYKDNCIRDNLQSTDELLLQPHKLIPQSELFNRMDL